MQGESTRTPGLGPGRQKFEEQDADGFQYVNRPEVLEASNFWSVATKVRRTQSGRHASGGYVEKAAFSSPSTRFALPT